MCRMNRIEQTRQKLLAQGKKIINLSSGNANEHGFFFDQKILQNAAKQFLAKPIPYHPDPKGDFKARKAITQYYRERGLQLPEEQILLTSGSSESYFHLLKHILKPGETVLFPHPGYPLIAELARLAEVQISPYNLSEKDHWRVDLTSLELGLKKGAKAIILISPNNPTGSVIGSAELKKIAALAKKYRAAVISDEVFSEFIFDGKDFPGIASLVTDIDVFTLNGVSKTYALPGLKLGWIAATGPHAAKHIDELERSVDAFLAANQISQSLIPAIITKGKPFLKKYQNLVESNRNLAVDILSQCPEITLHKPEGGFYLFAKIQGLNLDDEQFVIRLMQKTNIFVHPGYYYDYENGLWILISFLMEPAELKRTLATLVKFVEGM